MTSRDETDHWLQAVYKAPGRDRLKATYDQWADSYDADMALTGYVHFAVLCGLVGRHLPQRDAAILDAGVGTGGLGSLLHLLGYSTLAGCDMSDGMLARAARRNCYASLHSAILGEPLDFADARFDAILSTGTFTEGHAPASAMDELVRILKPGGVMIFTISTKVWEAMGFRAKLDGLVAAGLLTPVETTAPYQPMPYSPTEAHVTTRAHVLRRTG